MQTKFYWFFERNVKSFLVNEDRQCIWKLNISWQRVKYLWPLIGNWKFFKICSELRYVKLFRGSCEIAMQLILLSENIEVKAWESKLFLTWDKILLIWKRYIKLNLRIWRSLNIGSVCASNSLLFYLLYYLLCSLRSFITSPLY